MVKHPVILRGYQGPEPAVLARPLLVKRTDADFVPGLLEDLRRKLGAADLGRPDADSDGSGLLRLLQPVHRTFNLAVVEAVCARAGFPRLDPRSIESAGLVVRRVNGPVPVMDMRAVMLGARRRTASAHEEAWQHHQETAIGWKRIEQPWLDPDPARRLRMSTANEAISERLREMLQRLEPAAERVSPLFVAPPDVCEANGRTILYGVVPVTSREQVQDPVPVDLRGDDLMEVMPGFLRSLGRSGRPAVGEFIDLDSLTEVLGRLPDHPANIFVQELRMIQFGWRAFDTPEGAAIVTLLNRIPLRFRDSDAVVPLGQFLELACRTLVLRTQAPSRLPLPEDWPQPDAALAADLRGAVANALKSRLAGETPRMSRFDDPQARYVVRAFVRVRCSDGCPPELHWSEASEPFRIAPWWENGGPLHTISLPDLDPETVKKLKPNVSFALPPKLANLLNRMNPEDMLKGKGNLNDSPALGWICSFSLPVITLCAFIVLNIFLSLFHLIFGWLFYLKICLPVPRR